MRKIISFALIIVCFSFLISSCENTETYADKLEKESKAINRLKRDSSFVFIDTYPEDGVFEWNQFYRDPKTGVYYNVVDSGNGNRASKETPRTPVSVRFKGARFFGTKDTTAYQNTGMNEVTDEILFTYGLTSTYTGSSGSDYMIKSAGLVAPLEHVGQNAIIRIIIPFSTGSGYQQNPYYTPLYIDWVQYRFSAQ